jgi:hypothetical protein
MRESRRWVSCPAPLLCAAPDDTGAADAYMAFMRTLLYGTLFALLALSLWFAGSAFVQMSGDPIPLYGYFAIAGGVLVSLAVGGGLMALVFYSNRHGYDDLSGGDGGKTP